MDLGYAGKSGEKKAEYDTLHQKIFLWVESLEISLVECQKWVQFV